MTAVHVKNFSYLAQDGCQLNAAIINPSKKQTSSQVILLHGGDTFAASNAQEF